MYRLWFLFQHLTFNMAVSLLLSTIVRNLVFTIFLLHWAG